MSAGSSGTTSTASPPSVTEAADGLDQIVTDLRRLGAADAASRIERAIGTIRASPSGADFAEIESLIDPELVIDERTAACRQVWRMERSSGARGLSTRWARFRKSVHRAHFGRNFWALLPLIWTWVALCLAAWKYEESQSRESFLQFWQAGYGHLVWPLWLVALIDVVFLALVLGFTWWVHTAENSAAKFAEALYGALGRLKEASQGSMRAPVSADDWATAADRIITRAYTANEQLARGSREALEQATRQLASTQDNSLQLIKELQDVNRGFLAEFTGQTKGFVDQFSTEVLKTLANVRKDNEDFIKSTAETNQRTLQALVQQQMEPLLTQVQQLLGEFRTQQEAHAAAVTGLTRAVAALQGPADGLAGAARALTGSTQSIDGSLASMTAAQQELAAQLQGSAQGMTTAATALDGVKDALRETLVHSTREMTGNITQASASLRDTQAGLKGAADGLRETVDALAGTAADFRTATAQLAPATAPGQDLQQSIERLTVAIREAGPGRRARWPWRRSDGFGGR